jgi:Cu-Zn family superoxide dismutase
VVLLPALAAAALLAPQAAPAKGRSVPAYTLPGDQVFPEGVAVDSRRYYVGSTTDGTILSGGLRGRSAGVLLPGGTDGRTTAIGLKVDSNRLYVAGGATGSVWVYDLITRTLIRRFDTGTGGFLNDLTITTRGDAYVTDSRRPFLYRIGAADVRAGTGDAVGLEPFATYPGFQSGALNANGIVASGERTLLYVQSATGKLFRLDVPTRTIQAVDLGGADLSNGDGLVLKGRRLYVVRNQQGVVVKLRLSGDLREAEVVSVTRDPGFRFPTTAALAGGRLLVVNSQFDRRSAGHGARAALHRLLDPAAVGGDYL